MNAPPPLLDPNGCHITNHAIVRYGDRRNNGDAVSGLRRLLCRAAERPTPPLVLGSDHGPHRLVRVSGFCLVFDAQMGTLVTLWRQRRK